MNICKYFVPFILFFGLIFIHLEGKKEWPILKGPYLGQKPPGKTPEIFAPEIVSTKKFQEFSASFSPDGKEFYFTREVAPNRWIIMTVKQVSNVWTRPRTAVFSGKYRDLEMSVTPDDQKLFFCSDRPLTEGGTPKKDFDIWYVQRTNTGWTSPKNAGRDINSEGNEWYPTVSSKGTLYFCGGKRPGLYSAIKSDNGRYEKRMIGDLRTTALLGGHPYIAADESYLLTSAIKGIDSKGGWDLFVSFKKTDGSWTRSKNLGSNINTQASEDFPSVSRDGKYLFFTRLFKDEEGKDIVDIYWVDARNIKKLKPKKLK